MLYRFTKLLRSILPKASEMISLEEEIENIKNYVELQKMRYPDCFEVIYEVSENINDFKCLPLYYNQLWKTLFYIVWKKSTTKG